MKEETKCYCGHTTYCDCGTEEIKQQCYSEEELLEILASYADWSIFGVCSYQEWFKQFKKK